ncbi:MAG: restriction endonuclease subunit S [Pseudomonadota bacterium]
MSEWKECKIADAPFEIIDGDRGTNYPKQDQFNQTGYCLFLNAKNVTTNGFAFNECYFISKEKDKILRKGKLQRNDIILTTRGTVGNIGFFNERIPYDTMRINSGMVIIRSDPKGILPEYTHQLFKYLKGDFDVYATGSAQPQLPIRDLKEISFLLPPLPEQRAIANVLSSLDDKIDLLHRQNKTLEGMAEALWWKMFVEDTKNLKIVNLGEIIEIHDSKRIPLSSMQREKMKDGVLYPYYGAATVMDHINQYIFDGEYLLLGEDGTVETNDGYPVLQLATGKFWVNNHTHVLRAKKPFSNFLLYIILRNTNITHIVTGAVQPKINQENLKSLEISSARDITVNELSVVADNFWQKIQANNFQIRTLSRLRDTLLPKLMSGEVRVKT